MFILSDGRRSGIVFSYTGFLWKRLLISLGGRFIVVADADRYAGAAVSVQMGMALLTVLIAGANIGEEDSGGLASTIVFCGLYIGLLLYRWRHVTPVRLGREALSNRALTPAKLSNSDISLWTNAILLEIRCDHFIDPHYRILKGALLALSTLVLLVNALAFLFGRYLLPRG